jgi:hypothetical protein
MENLIQEDAPLIISFFLLLKRSLYFSWKKEKIEIRFAFSKERVIYQLSRSKNQLKTVK